MWRRAFLILELCGEVLHYKGGDKQKKQLQTDFINILIMWISLLMKVQCNWELYLWVKESMNNSPLRRNKFEGDIMYTPNPPKIGDKKDKSWLIIVNSCQTFQTSQKPLTNFGMKDY